MRELSLSEIGMVSGGAGAVAGATYYVVSNTLAGNQMDKEDLQELLLKVQ